MTRISVVFACSTSMMIDIVAQRTSAASTQPMDRTATKSRVQPTSHWSAGRFCPGT